MAVRLDELDAYRPFAGSRAVGWVARVALRVGWVLAPRRRCLQRSRRPSRCAAGRSANQPRSTADDLVDEAVFLRRLRGQPVVAVGVLPDTLDGLPGPLGEDRIEALAEQRELLRMDLD